MSGELFSEALLVEDEKSLQTALEIALKKLGIHCRVASNLTQARKLFAEKLPPFILLDRTLPDGDGLTLCRSLREEGYTGAILMLTAHGQVHERVEGLNAGADDYLPKPFSWQELEARIRTLARRAPATPSPAPALWGIDEQRLRIQGPRGWVELTPLEFKLAARLILAGGAIVSRDDLLKDVWGFTLLPKTRTVDHFLGRMRKHFEADPENPRHFLTVRGAGYRFER
ncbi:MAG: response regulator transcription factor [Bdellovibrionota bacterium]